MNDTPPELLAHHHHSAQQAVEAGREFILPRHWPSQMDILDACQHMSPGVATLLLVVGAIYIMYGYNIYKGLIVINAAILGAALGATLGHERGAEVPLAIVGGLLAAAVTWPLMKWAVAVMGGLFGALLGASLWRLADLDPSFTWAGALIGMVSLGLFSFILFRGCIMMYTSLQGSVMLITGLLGLAYKYPGMAASLSSHMQINTFTFPLAIFVPTVIGLVYQHHNGAAGAPPAKKPSH